MTKENVAIGVLCFWGTWLAVGLVYFIYDMWPISGWLTLAVIAAASAAWAIDVLGGWERET